MCSFPDQIGNIKIMEEHLKPITIDNCRRLLSKYPPENMKEIRCRLSKYPISGYKYPMGS
jgi:hypothetical protein